MIDERSLFVLGTRPVASTTYNSRVIRSLITRVHDNLRFHANALF